MHNSCCGHLPDGRTFISRHYYWKGYTRVYTIVTTAFCWRYLSDVLKVNIINILRSAVGQTIWRCLQDSGFCTLGSRWHSLPPTDNIKQFFNLLAHTTASIKICIESFELMTYNVIQRSILRPYWTVLLADLGSVNVSEAVSWKLWHYVSYFDQ